VCGLIGIVNERGEAAPDLYFGLLAMQHRGKESAGIAVAGPGEAVRFAGGAGELPQAFGPTVSPDPRPEDRGHPPGAASDAGREGLVPRVLHSLHGTAGVGHVRYGTTGASGGGNVQPLRASFRGRDFYLCHNGNLVNTRALRRSSGSPESGSDTRVIADLIAASTEPTFEAAFEGVLCRLEGAFNLVALFGGAVYAARDGFGFHPLHVGERGGDRVIASETCVLDLLGAVRARDVLPGELVVLDRHGVRVRTWAPHTSLKFDLFEYIYFLRPDSRAHGVEAAGARYCMGRALAREHPFEGEMIVPVSDSGNHAALGYYEERLAAGADAVFRPWALFRPHTVSRTFIEPFQERREHYLRLKFNPRPEEIRGRRLVVVDDSVVRGNTLKAVSRLLRQAGAREIRVAVSSPMYRYPDFYGIDTYRVRGELVARRARGDVRRIAEELGGLDGLGYLSLEATKQAVIDSGRNPGGLSTDSFYTGPFNGDYPAGTGEFAADGEAVG